MAWGTGASVTAQSFGTFQATAGKNNKDVAQFNDSGKADTFTADSTAGTLVGNGFTFKAAGFQRLVANATSGAKDTATLTDSKGNDTFAGGPAFLAAQRIELLDPSQRLRQRRGRGQERRHR